MPSTLKTVSVLVANLSGHSASLLISSLPCNERLLRSGGESGRSKSSSAYNCNKIYLRAQTTTIHGRFMFAQQYFAVHKMASRTTVDASCISIVCAEGIRTTSPFLGDISNFRNRCRNVATRVVSGHQLYCTYVCPISITIFFPCGYLNYTLFCLIGS